MLENNPDRFDQDELRKDQAEFDLKRDIEHYQGYEGERTPVGLEVNPTLGIPQAYVGNAFQGPKFFLDELQVGMTASEVEDLASSVRDESTPEEDLITIPTLEEYVSGFLNQKVPLDSNLSELEVRKKIELQTESVMRLVDRAKLTDLNNMIYELKNLTEGFRDGVRDAEGLANARELFQAMLKRAEQELSKEEKLEISQNMDDDFSTRQNPAA